MLSAARAIKSVDEYGQRSCASTRDAIAPPRHGCGITCPGMDMTDLNPPLIISESISGPRRVQCVAGSAMLTDGHNELQG